MDPSAGHAPEKNSKNTGKDQNVRMMSEKTNTLIILLQICRKKFQDIIRLTRQDHLHEPEYRDLWDAKVQAF
jgi:hypothetical protein